MDLLVVVSVPLLLLLIGDGPQRDLNIGVLVLGADHEANLAGRVGRDGGVGVLNGREDFAARLLELGDELEVEPLVLGCNV